MHSFISVGVFSSFENTEGLGIMRNFNYITTIDKTLNLINYDDIGLG